MAGCCCCCSRTLVLSDEESCLLQAAAEGIVAVTEDARGCARALKRLGYLLRVAEGRYAITEHGRRRLAERLASDGAGQACSLPSASAAHCGETASLASS